MLTRALIRSCSVAAFAVLGVVLVAVGGCKLRAPVAGRTLAAAGSAAPRGSTFERAMATAPAGQVPYPFSRLLAHLSHYGEPLAILGPIGRSLQSAAGMPNPFADPRRLVAFAGRRADLDFDAKVFVGYVEAAKQIEVISYNERTGAYDFQLVSNYADGAVPTISTPPRDVCTACHQQGGPIFTPLPWSEFNGNAALASLILRHNPSGEVDGIPVAQPVAAGTITPTVGGGRVSPKFELAVRRAAATLAGNQAWQSACRDDKIRCRGDIFKASVGDFLGVRRWELGSKLEQTVARNVGSSEAAAGSDPVLASLPSPLLTDRDYLDDAVVALKPGGALSSTRLKILPRSLGLLDEAAYAELAPDVLTQGPSALKSLLRDMGSDRYPERSSTSATKVATSKEIDRELKTAELHLASYGLAKLTPKDDPKSRRQIETFSLVNLIGAVKDRFWIEAKELIVAKTLLPENRDKKILGTVFIILRFAADDTQLRAPQATFSARWGESGAIDKGESSFQAGVEGSCQPVTEQELSCTFPTAAQTLRLPIASTATQPSKFVAQIGGRSANLEVLCSLTSRYVSSRDKSEVLYYYECTEFDLRLVEAAVDRVVAKNLKDDSGSLHRDALNPPQMLNELLVELDIPPFSLLVTQAAEPDAGIVVPAAAPMGSSETVKDLFRYCGDCHAAAVPVEDKRVPQFLAGASLVQVCAALKPQVAAMTAALEAGRGEESYMPPPAAKLNRQFDDGRRAALIQQLQDGAFCP